MTTGIRPLATALALGILLELAATGNEDLQYALSLMGERQEYAQAAEKLQQCLRGGMDREEAEQALYYLGNCYTRLGKDTQAAQTYEKLLSGGCKVEKYLQDALCLGGDAWFREGEYSKAAGLYDRLLKEYPQIDQAEACAYWKAECLARLYRKGDLSNRDNYNAARKAYTEFTVGWPQSENCEEALLSSALLAYEAKDYKQARNELQGFMQKYPQSGQFDAALCYASESAYWLGDYAPARKGFDKLVRDYPQSRYVVQALSACGWAAYALGDKSGAGKLFAAAAEKQADNSIKKSAGYLQAAGAYDEAGNLEVAEKYYRMAAEEGGENAGLAHYRLGVMLQRQAIKSGSLAQKKELFSKVVEELQRALPLLGKTNSERLSAASLVLAETYLQLEKRSEAADAFAIVARDWPQSDSAPYALYQQAASLASMGKADQAADTIRNLLSTYPESQLRLRAAYAMADYQQRLGQSKKGVLAYRWLVDSGCKWAQDYKADDSAVNTKLLQQAHELRQKALVRLGELELAENKLQLARESLELLIKDYPQSTQIPAALLRLGEVCQKSGKVTEADSHYEKSAALAKSMLAVVKDTEEIEVLAQISVESAYRSRVCRLLAAQKAPHADREKLLRDAGKFCQEYINDFTGNTLATVQLGRVHYYLAESLYGLGNNAAAAEEYRKAYDVENQGPLADACLFGLGWSLREKDIAGAVKNLQLLLEKFPRSEYRAEAGLLLGSCLQQQGKNAQSLEVVDKYAIDTDGKPEVKARALLQKSKIQEAAGELSGAADSLENLLRDYPQSSVEARALYNLSWLLQKMSDQHQKDAVRLAEIQKKTETVLIQLLRDHADFAAADECALRLGEFAYAQKKYDKSLDYYKQAFKSSGESKLNDRICYRLGCVYSKLSEAATGNEKTALQGKAVKAFRDSLLACATGEIAAECAWRAGEILRENNKLSEAVELYIKASEQSEDSQLRGGARFGLAMCNMKLDKFGEALVLLKEILADKESRELWHEANCAAGQACLMLGALEDSQEFFTVARGDGYGGEAAARARLGLGEVALRKQDYRKAREEFRKVDVFHKQWQEDAANGLLKAAAVSRELGEFAAVVKDLQLLLKKYPDSRVAGQARQQLAQVESAKRDKQ